MLYRPYAHERRVMEDRTSQTTIIIPLTERDFPFVGDIIKFHAGMTARLQGFIVIVVNEAGMPLAPAIEVTDIPEDAIWLPFSGL